MESLDILAFVATGACIAVVMKGITQAVFGGKPKAGLAGWRGVVYVCLWLIPLAIGAVLGWGTSLPAPPAMGDGLSGRIIWYTLAGGLSPTLYSAIQLIVQQKTGVKERHERESQRPPAPEPEA